MGKKYADYTVDDLVRLDLSFLLKDKTDEEKVAQRDAFIYLKNTARSCRIDIGNWKLLEMFGDGTSSNMVTDKAKINEILFSRIHESKEADATNGLGFSLLGNFKGEILEATKVDYDSVIRSHKRDLESVNTYLTDYQNRVNKYIRRARNHHKEIDELEAKKLAGIADDTVYKAVQQILSNPYWQFIGIKDDGNKLLFATTEYVKQSLVNPAAGINIHVEYGVYYVEINLTGKLINCYPYMDSLYVYNPHPHVSSGGTICWGNYSSTVQEHIGADRWKDVMDILQTLLTTYCGDNPYTAIETINDYYKTLFTPPEQVDSASILEQVFSGSSEESHRRVITKGNLDMDTYPLHVTPTRDVPIYLPANSSLDETHEDYPFMAYTLSGREEGLFIWNMEHRRLYMTMKHSDTPDRIKAVRMCSDSSASVFVGREGEMNYNKFKVFKSYKHMLNSIPFMGQSFREEHVLDVFNSHGIFIGSPIAKIREDGSIRRNGILRSFNGRPTTNSFFSDYWSNATFIYGYGSSDCYFESIVPRPLRGESKVDYIDRLEKYKCKLAERGNRIICEDNWSVALGNLLDEWTKINGEESNES